LGAGAVLMGAHNRAVDHGVLIIGVAAQMSEKASPNTGLRPPRKPCMNLDGIAEPPGQIAPGNSRPIAE
jgi:hypothetical protein